MRNLKLFIELAAGRVYSAVRILWARAKSFSPNLGRFPAYDIVLGRLPATEAWDRAWMLSRQ